MTEPEETGEDRGGILRSLLSPLRLPERLLEAVDALAESARELGPVRSELTRVADQTESLGGLLPALDAIRDELGERLTAVLEVVRALESQESHLNREVGALGGKVDAVSGALDPVGDRLEAIEHGTDRLAREVDSIHQTLRGVQHDIQRITGLRGERGAMERARDALIGRREELRGSNPPRD